MRDAHTTQQGLDAKAFDFEDAGHRVDGLLRLAHWVERARGLSEALDGAAQCDPDLKARLQAHGIAYADCWWEDEEQNGLLQLMRLAYRDVAEMTRAGMAAAKARAGTGGN